MTPRLTALLERALVVAIVAMMLASVCMLAIAVDVHSARVEFATANAEWRRETFRRMDALLWKADTALEVASALRLDLGATLTKLRAQVKQASDANTQATASQTKAAAVTVAKALDTTRQAIEAVAGDAPLIEKHGPADLPEKPITVNVPPPTVIAEKPAEAPRVTIAERSPKRRRWYTYIWHWW